MHARHWLCDYHTLGQVSRGAAWEKTHPPPRLAMGPDPSLLLKDGPTAAGRRRTRICMSPHECPRISPLGGDVHEHPKDR